MSWKEPRACLAGWLLVAATLACLLPFSGRAFHMDDPLFVWTARHIESHPLDFYGFDVYWSEKPKPMAQEMKNPPLAAYYMAAVARVLGWSERGLHFGFLVPALALVLGSYRLGRRFSAHPFAVALATLATPVFLLSSVSVMCDTMMAALWVWAMFFWIQGLEPENPRRLLLAAFLMAACCLTKYFGVCLIPLLAAYSMLRLQRPGRWLLYFVPPILALAACQWVTARLYGVGLLSSAMDFVSTDYVHVGCLSRIIETLSFCGGCLLIVLAALPLFWGGRAMMAAAAAVAAAGWLFILMRKVGDFSVVQDGHVKWLFVLQLGLFVLGGAIVLALAVTDAVRNRTADSILLLFWVVGALIFVGGINWTVSGRNMLPLAPAAAVLMVRRLEYRQKGAMGYFWWPLGISLAVALSVAWADWNLAGLGRRVASQLKSQLAPHVQGIAFEGHWGFQYYMDQIGAKPLERNPKNLVHNQAIIVPLGGALIFDPPYKQLEPLFVIRDTPARWLCVQNIPMGAGYYSAAWGPAPFVFGAAPPEAYYVFKVK